MIEKLQTENKVVGTKQVIRSLKNDNVKLVFLAKDAKGKNIETIIEESKKKNIEIQMVSTMKKLGKLCNIDVNAATAALLK